MLTTTLTLLFMSALVAGQVQVGAIRAVAIEGNDNGLVRFRVTGINPCGAVHIDYGDGEAITTPIEALPATITHRYTRSGDYAIAASGMGNCEGRTALNVRTAVAPPAPTPPPSPSRGRGVARGCTREVDESLRFPEMDRNDDGVITRDEWQGSMGSFRVHDWNRDGVLSGAEVRVGQARPDDTDADPSRGGAVPSWSRAVFQRLDRDSNNRLTYDEWPYDVEGFRRADVNDDRVLTAAEFLATDIDDDRDDRFDDLDLNNDEFVSQAEWHGGRVVFERMDRNRDGKLSRSEVIGETAATPTGSAWRVAVPANVAWTDTGLTVRAGDELVISSRGEIALSQRAGDRADAGGSVSGRVSARTPLPRELMGTLIARVERGAPIALSASGGRIRVPQTGRLFLGVNDDSFADNSGQFEVTVRQVK